MKSYISLLFFFLSVSWMNLAAEDTSREIKFSIIETSDVHGNYFPYDFIRNRPGEGSLSRISTYVKRLRSEMGDERVLLVDNGDILQGQPTAYYFDYVDTTTIHLCARMMNDMGYLCATLGNHDIETGHPVYDRWMDQCGFTVLGANVFNKKKGRLYLPAYVQEEVEGIRIGVLGMVTPTIPQWLPEKLWKDLEFKDCVETARRVVPIMRRAAKADIVVVLMHSGVGQKNATGYMLDNAAFQVAEQVPDIDILFCGHDHRMANTWIQNLETGNKTLVLNPGANAMSIAQADITVRLDTNGEIKDKSVTGEVVNICYERPDSDLLKHYQADFDAVKAYTQQVIGFNKIDLDTRAAYFGPSPFVDFIHSLQLRVSHADISFAAPLSYDAKIPSGKIMVADLFNLYKYENQLYVMRLTGAEIKNYLEESYGIWTSQMHSSKDHLILFSGNYSKANEPWQRLRYSSYNFDSAAGIRYTVDVRQPKGKKIKILSMADGSPFDPDKYYKVAVNSYRANGGGGLMTNGAGIPQNQLRSRVVWTSPNEMREYLRREISRQKEINPRSLNQWRFIPEGWAAAAGERDAEIMFR